MLPNSELDSSRARFQGSQHHERLKGGRPPSFPEQLASVNAMQQVGAVHQSTSEQDATSS
jgi:hypothetical protein